jgi:hypothetical protein
VEPQGETALLKETETDTELHAELRRLAKHWRRLNLTYPPRQHHFVPNQRRTSLQRFGDRSKHQQVHSPTGISACMGPLDTRQWNTFVGVASLLVWDKIHFGGLRDKRPLVNLYPPTSASCLVVTDGTNVQGNKRTKQGDPTQRHNAHVMPNQTGFQKTPPIPNKSVAGMHKNVFSRLTVEYSCRWEANAAVPPRRRGPASHPGPICVGYVPLPHLKSAPHLL